MTTQRKPVDTAPDTKRRSPKRWTVTHLAALPTRPSPYTDPAQPGLQLFVRPLRGGGASRTWYLRYWFQGTEHRMPLGTFPATGLDDARGMAREAREQAAKGIDPRRGRPRRHRPPAPLPVGAAVSAPDAKHSIEAVVADFMARFIEQRHKDPKYVRRILDVEVLAEWKGRDVRSIEPTEVDALLDGIVARGKNVMANRVAGTLGLLFKWAIHRKHIKASPVQLLFRPGGPEAPRDRALSDDELAAVLGNLDAVLSRAPRTASAIRIALYTACRRGELALAKWSDIKLDGDAPTWRVPPETAKTGVEYITPLVPEAVAEFRVLKRAAGRSPYVFPAESGEGPADPKLLTRSVLRHLAAFAKHKVETFTLHDLRRTVRTGLSRLKVQSHIAERVLNHKAPGIQSTYDVHEYLDEKREALTKWADHLGSLVKPS